MSAQTGTTVLSGTPLLGVRDLRKTYATRGGLLGRRTGEVRASCFTW